VAIVLQGIAATAIALMGQYEKILNYEVAVDFILFALVATSLFVFRRREGSMPAGVHGVPGHPYTTAIFVIACVAIVGSTVWNDPGNAVIGWLILLTGIPVYLYWSRRRA
jgi:APA family basic amino acid/polyamine antiporter